MAKKKQEVVSMSVSDLTGPDVGLEVAGDFLADIEGELGAVEAPVTAEVETAEAETPLTEELNEGTEGPESGEIHAPESGLKGSDLTTAFKEMVRANLQQSTGAKLNRDKSWLAFKALVSGIVDFTVKNGRIPLSGVGTFEIIKAGARKSKVDTHNFVPKFRFRPGSKIDEYLEKTIKGVFIAGAPPVKDATPTKDETLVTSESAEPIQ